MKKLFLLMVILAAGSVLFFPGCAGAGSLPEPVEIKYDIQGQWTITRIFGDGAYSLVITCTFVGDKKQGTMVPESGISGTYNVGGDDGLQVEFSFSYYENGNRIFEKYRGQFINRDNMNGTGSQMEYIDGRPFTLEFAWGARRI